LKNSTFSETVEISRVRSRGSLGGSDRSLRLAHPVVGRETF